MHGNDSESSSSDDNAQMPALPIGALPGDFDPTKPPSTAEEYLHQVM